MPILNKKLAIVESHLQNNKCLMGNQFTLADSYLFVILIWLARLKYTMSDWPNLLRYFGEMKQRSSVKMALQEEELLMLDFS